MTLRFCDSFDHYATADITAKWTTNVSATISAGNGRFSTAGAYLGNGSNGISKTLDSQATWYVGFGLKVVGLGSGNVHPVKFYDTAQLQSDIRIDTTGRLYATKNGTTLGTGRTPLTLGVWYFIEVRMKIDPSAGEVALRINGVDETIDFLSGAWNAQNTRQSANSSANKIQFGGGNGDSSATWYLDDVYICDTGNGSGAGNNTYLGDIRVVALYPTGAGNYAEWTPSTGANYACVDDTAASTGTGDYTSSSTPNQKDTFAFGNISQTGTVKGIQHNIYAEKDDAGSRSIAPLQRSGATAADYNGTTVAMASSYAYVREVIEINPATSAVYTVQNVNDAEFGYIEIS